MIPWSLNCVHRVFRAPVSNNQLLAMWTLCCNAQPGSDLVAKSLPWLDSVNELTPFGLPYWLQNPSFDRAWSELLYWGTLTPSSCGITPHTPEWNERTINSRGEAREFHVLLPIFLLSFLPFPLIFIRVKHAVRKTYSTGGRFTMKTENPGFSFPTPQDNCFGLFSF